MMRFLLLTLSLLLSSCTIAQTTPPSPLGSSRQLIVVSTPDWSSVDGVLQKYERRSGEAWQRVGQPVPIVVGRAGLAWGKGVVSTVAFRGPRKSEGDGKAPAGIYRFGRAFGFGSETVTGRSIDFAKLSETTECVDDSASQFYNRIVDRDKVTPVDWKSSERMRSVPAYRIGIVVEHNGAAIPRAGSCIFMHLWSGAGHGTAGCTAMNDGALEELLGWLDGEARPLLVQLPAAEYDRLRDVWSLP